MAMTNSFSDSAFNKDVVDLIDRLECREVVFDSEREQVCRLRYAAYLREGAIPAGGSEHFMDSMDETENGKTFGLYLCGQLASSIRLHVASAASPMCPATQAFPECLRPMLEAGQTVIDPTRIVLDTNCARKHRKLPYATVRVAWMACEHVRADVLLATVGAEHQAFYRGLFGHRVISSARSYPPVGKPVSLMALSVGDAKERVLRRYPFLRSTERERNAIFGSSERFGPARAPRLRDAACAA
jgi:hypothetical protein